MKRNAQVNWTLLLVAIIVAIAAVTLISKLNPGYISGQETVAPLSHTCPLVGDS